MRPSSLQSQAIPGRDTLHGSQRAHFQSCHVSGSSCCASATLLFAFAFAWQKILKSSAIRCDRFLLLVVVAVVVVLVVVVVVVVVAVVVREGLVSMTLYVDAHLTRACKNRCGSPSRAVWISLPLSRSIPAGKLGPTVFSQRGQ